MTLTRRAWIATTAGLAAQAQPQKPQFPPGLGPEPGPRKRPLLCLFSKHLQKLEYVELGGVLRQLGFEGCDLTVRPGGHVEPDKVQVDLMRAIESIRGDGVDVAMITTDLTKVGAFTTLAILAIAGRSGVRYFKPGYWRYGPDDNIETRLAEVRRDAAGLVALGRQYGIAAGFHNHSGNYVGQSVWETSAIIEGFDPRWAGYYFDPCHASAEGGVAGWQIALRKALPRLKMLAMKDFYWEKAGGKWKMQMCPLGQGMVAWPKVFSMLAAAKFMGPLSLHVEYDPPDVLGAIAKDFQYVRKQVEVAYGT